MSINLLLSFTIMSLQALQVQAGERSLGRELIKGILSDGSSVLTNGFARGTLGETIDYHSVNETARLALLVRTTDGAMAIEWRTAPLPSTKTDFVTLFWLSAISGSKGAHMFALTINGKLWFSFSAPTDSTQGTWTLQHPSGGSLSFAAIEADRYGDFFGYTFLRIPTTSFRPSDSLTIRITGEAAGSSCWYMTFEHPMGDAARVDVLPALLRENGKVRQVVKIALEHYGYSKDFDVFIDPAHRVTQRLDWGATTIMLSADSVGKATPATVTIESGGKTVEQVPVTLRPVRKRELWLLPHSHNDIGYSDHQTVVEQKQMQYLEDAIAITRRSTGYPAGSQFRWNVEILWPLESYLRRASEEQKRTLIDAIKRGWIGVNGLYANELTGLCRPEELYHLTDFARQLATTYGIAVDAAMITDIPSYTSNIVTALAESGIKYFSSGPNYSPSMPDGGDRIGHTLREWGDRPFYWESQSGQSRVLFWMTGTGYSFFHGWLMGRLAHSNTAPIFQYLERLDSTQYPYDMVQLRYTIDGDNGPPDPDLADFVKGWNERYVSPVFHIASTHELFEEFERRYGKTLPILKGDLTPIWEDGAASTAYELALNRRTAEKLVQAEILYSMIDPKLFPFTDAYSAWRNVVLFDEHTWGAWNSVSEPDSPSVIAQWDYKRDMVMQSSNKASELLKNILDKSNSTPGPTTALNVINTNSWSRTDLVLIPEAMKVAGPRVRDANGNGLPSQILANGALAVYVTDVPPFGIKQLFFAKGAPYRPLHPVSVSGTSLAGNLIRVQVNPQDGSIEHVRDLSVPGIEVELVDLLHGSGIDEYIYVAGRDPSLAVRDSSVSISSGEKGPLVASIVVTSAPAGTRTLRREISLIAGLDRVDLVNTVDKLKVREKESVHFGFPFLILGGKIRVDEGLEVIRPEVDQLRGANKDYFSVQRWVDVSNDTRGVTWATVDAPLVEVGKLTSENRGPAGYRVWRDTLAPAQNFYSYAMNNYWHTNYKADQEGIVTFRYALRPHGAFDRPGATRFGIERSQPLLVQRVMPTVRAGTPLLAITPASVIATSIVPSTDGTGWCVHLLNTADSTVSVRLNWRNDVRVAMFVSDLYEKRKGEVQLPLILPRSGVLMLKVEKR